MPEPWFRAREDGWGWTPADGRGRAAVAALVLLLAANFLRLFLTCRTALEAYAVSLPQAMGLLLAFAWLLTAKGEPLPSLREAPWFKAKRFGLGWTPASPEAWLAVGLFAAVLTASTLALVKFRPQPPSAQALLEHVALAALAAASLIGICVRTGEPLGWRWGRRG